MSVGNRNESRLRTRLRARLISKFAEDRVVLLNLSQRGCCLEASQPGGSKLIILRWEGFEAFGEIVWAMDRRIGIRFERPVPYEWVLATREVAEAAAPICEIHDARESARAWAEGKRLV